MAAGFSKLFKATELLKPSFEGRITFEEYTRAGFWIYVATVVVVIICLIGFVVADSLKVFTVITSITTTVVGIAIFVSWLSLMARRLHDVGYTANYLWLFLLCGIGGIVPTILCLGDTVGDNEWGPGNNNHQGSNFSDFKRSINYILHPESRLSLKEFGLASTLLYWIDSLINNICSGIEQLEKLSSGHISSGGLSALQSTDDSLGVSDVLVLIACVVYIVFYLRIAIPRLHDTGRSGHYWWLLLACGVGGLIPMVMCFGDSDDDNEYGLKRDDNNDSDSNDLDESKDPYSFYASNHSSNDECIE